MMAVILVAACRAPEAPPIRGEAPPAADDHAASEASAPAKGSDPDAASRVPVPANSPLAKVKAGMGLPEVTDLIGPPTDMIHYVTGKAFIPYYFGDDRTRLECHYKGIGRVIFSGGGAFGQRGSVQWVEYDPKEPGYVRAN
jgi:hypothetical protein